MKTLLATSIVMIIAGVCFFVWEERSTHTTPMAYATQTKYTTMTKFYPGGNPGISLSEEDIHEEFSGYDVSEGKRLFRTFNCSTCHANGGGDIGPAFMDEKWLYGSEPRNIYSSIIEGRPNGMPSFGGKIPDAQTWQIVAYIRSITAQTPLATRSGRNDDIQSTLPETRAEKKHPVRAQSPGAVSK